MSRHDLARRVAAVRDQIQEKLSGLALSNLPIVTVSGHQKRGIVQLQRELAALVPADMSATQKKSSSREENENYDEMIGQLNRTEKINKSEMDVTVKRQPTTSKHALVSHNVKTNNVRSNVTDPNPELKDSNNREIDIVHNKLQKENKASEDPAKIAIGLKPRKSIIKKPSMDEYEASKAPLAKGQNVSLNMSDRLNSILEHYFAGLENDEGSNNKDPSVGAVSKEKVKPGSLGRFITQNRMKMNEKTGLFASEIDSEKISCQFKRESFSEKKQKKMEKKLMYKSRYASKKY